MYHIVYLTTNLVNNKMYVGVHSTYNLDDGYIGSGISLNLAILKYGINNFKRDILHYAYDRNHAFEIESQIVDSSFITRKDTYNMIIGGMGITHTMETKYKISIKQKIHWSKFPRKLSQSHKDRIKYVNSNPSIQTKLKKSLSAKNRKPVTIETRLKISNSLKNRIISDETRKKISIANRGKTLSKETKIKQSISMKIKEKILCEYCNVYINNGNYKLYHGENCLLNPNINKDIIKKHRTKTEDWKNKNRKPKLNTDKYKGKYINNGTQCKKVNEDELPTYIETGWVRGRLFHKFTHPQFQ